MRDANYNEISFWQAKNQKPAMTEDTDFWVKSGTNPAEPSLTGSNKYY